jgi:hypothetical protein
MSGGTSTLWRTSLCGVVMALTVFGTGCAVDTGESDEEDVVAVQLDVTIGAPNVSGGLKTPSGPLTNPLAKTGAQAKSPSSSLDQVAEPEPEPWHPNGRASSDDPDNVTVSTTPGRPDDRK